MARKTFLTYQPEGFDAPMKWPFDPLRILTPEAELIEDRSGMTLAEWENAVARGSMRAIHAFVWVMMRRDNRALEYDSVQFCLDEIEIVAEGEDLEGDPKGTDSEKEASPIGGPSTSSDSLSD
jgi:hypothetical protein